LPKISPENAKVLYMASSTAYCAVAVIFLLLRSCELVSLVTYSAAGGFLVTLLCLALLSLFLSPSQTIAYMLRRFALITLVLVQIKQNLDHDVKLNLKFKNLEAHVAIVTGGNSGTGLAIAKQLVGLGSTVIITCRSQTRCQTALSEIGDLYPLKRHLVVPMLLDLADLRSVKSFSADFLRRYSRLDILINNAGLIAEPGEVTTQGLEQSFGAMHLGHFALTKYLLKLLLKPLPSGTEAARVVNVASDSMMVGNFHPSLMFGSGGGDLSRELTDNCGTVYGMPCCPLLACPHTNGYARAKLANVLHAYELQRRVDEYISENSKIGYGAKKFRRLVTASLHPGSVHTNIASLLASKVVALVLRSADQAAYILMHAVLEDSFVPSSYIDGLRKPHDLFNYRDRLQKHLNAFPAARSLPFAESAEDRSLHSLLWHSHSLVQPHPANTAGELFRKEAVAARLWDVSEQLLRDWEAGRPLFYTQVPVGRRPPKLRL